MSDDTIKASDSPFPISATIAGLRVVTIPLDDYCDLLGCRLLVRTVRAGIRAGKYAPRAGSLFARYPEVAAFFRDGFGRETVDNLITECRQRFGDERTPGRSSAYEYWSKLRRKAYGYK